MYQLKDSKEHIEQDSIYKTFGLNLSQKSVIAFVGAGGKTTTIYQLGKELASLGKKVIITTTTHMFLPKEYGVLNEDKEELLKLLNLNGIAVAGIPCEGGKISRVSEPFYEWMKTAADYILVEADGSKRLPVKVPGEHEPVLPKDTQLVVIVAGLTCLSHPIMECCHRWKLAMEILDCEPTHKILSQDVAKLIAAGYCKELRIPFKILLNQCDNEELEVKAAEIINYLKEEAIAVDNVAVGNFLPILTKI